MKAPIVLILSLCVATPSLAERADRDKPVNLEADRITVAEAKQVHVFEGRVQPIQGTLIIRTEKLVVTQDAEGFQRGVAYSGEGGLAHFRQKREGKDEYVEGEAERLEYDGKKEVAQFFTRAHVKSGLDEVRGQYISYDGKSENYVVTNGPGGTVVAPVDGRDARVRAVIQPKNKDGKPGAKPSSNLPAPPLKATSELITQTQE